MKIKMKSNGWRGCKDIEMVSHGEWSDPDLVWEDYTFNYYDVENGLWNMFLEDTGHIDSESGDPEVEEEFDTYCQENAVPYMEELIEFGYFVDCEGNTWHNREV